MKRKIYKKFVFVLVVIMFLTTGLMAQIVPTITGPAGPGMLETVSGGITQGVPYSTEPGMTGYQWVVSSAGAIMSGQGTNSITVDWTNPTGQQFISVTYIESTALSPTVLIINYYPFPAPINPATIPQFIDPLPHFGAGLRVNAKAGGSMTITAKLVQQRALPSTTPLATGATGMGNYAGYEISYGGQVYGAMWPARTIETQQGQGLNVQYQNGLSGVTYDAFNILADQTLMMNGYTLNGTALTDPYTGPIPMVTHLHGGEIPSGSDGGPNAWFMPPGATGNIQGPAFQFNASTLTSYPNMQEASTIWYHPHDDGLTRINVYTGLAGFYFIRGADEVAAKLPGWSGDDLVREITPNPAVNSPTFNGTNAYPPEIEIAIQDRMFNVKGELYWPVAPPNADLHPFWTPEFVGDVMTVNGKSWPYLSVAPRKYRFHLLDGCNARWLNVWLVNAADGVTPGPAITVVGGDGGLLAAPVPLDPALAQTLIIGPGQRYDVVIDFTGIQAGTAFNLMNDAATPYPFGAPVVPGVDDRIMQFVVNGEMVSAANTANPGIDNSMLPVNLRPVNPMVQLTDFAGKLVKGVNPVVTRQIILNEVMGNGGPASVQVNNSYFEAALAVAGDPNAFGGPTEIMTEGTTEIIQIANVSADAHPLHIHLLQWQLVSRQLIDDVGYLQAYAAAWAQRGLPSFPLGMAYPGGAGSPFDYNIPNKDGALGGNPEFSTFTKGNPIIPALPEERGWKDNTTVLPGMVTTFVVRVAPTSAPINATPQQLLLPFDPSDGPGYVWHCHVIDHEDMSMMRPLIILPSPVRKPNISSQPVSKTACVGDAVSFTVTAASVTPMTYQWQISTGGAAWTNLANIAPYTGATTPTLGIASALALSGNQYQCLVTNIDGTITSNPVTLTVNNCVITGTLKYNNLALDPLGLATVNVNGLTAITDAITGAFTISGVTSGTYPVVVTNALAAGGINSTDAGRLKFWANGPYSIGNVSYLAGDVDNNAVINATDAQVIQTNFVKAKLFNPVWEYHNTGGSIITSPPAFVVTVDASKGVINNTSTTPLDIRAMCSGDFNGSFSPTAVSTVALNPSGNTFTATSATPFDLPIRLQAGGQVGAMSLIINVPSTLVTVKNVFVPGSLDPVSYILVGNELRIGWNSLTPVTVPANGVLVTLTLVPTTSFSAQVMSIGLVANSLNELADGLYTPINGPVLVVDDVKVAPGGTLNALNLVANPNPAQLSTTISYKLPEDGFVTLGIYNTKGVLVMSLFSNKLLIASIYSDIINVSTLIKGTYYIRISFAGTSGLTLSQSIKFMKK